MRRKSAGCGSFSLSDLILSDMTIRIPYEDLLREILDYGTHKSDRTGTGTTSLFGRQIRFDLNEGFPLITTKKVHVKSVVGELLWFLKGDSNIMFLHENSITIWDEWADNNGDLGPVYGVQWRSWPAPDGRHIDQIQNALDTLKSNPDSRRNIVTAWNVASINDMALPPCHLLFQLYVADDNLSCQVYQRSADMFLGVPFNLASYGLLTHMLAQQAGLGVGELVWTGGDCHIYDNHREQVQLQLTRTPREYPTLQLNKASSMFDYRISDVAFNNYNPHPAIRGEVAV